MTYTIFIYIFQTWGITLFDAPYSYRETPPSKVMIKHGKGKKSLIGGFAYSPITKHFVYDLQKIKAMFSDDIF